MSIRLSLPSMSLVATAAAVLLLAAAPSEAAMWPFHWGKAPAPVTDVDTGMVVAQTAGDAGRLDQVEAEMRTLTGQIEQLTHQLQTLQDQLKRMQADTEFRFGELEGAGAAKGTPPAAAAQSTPPAPAAAAAVSQTQVAAQAPSLPADQVKPSPPKAVAAPAAVAVAEAPADGGVQLGAPPQPLGTLTLDAPPAEEKPLDLSSLGGGGSGDATDQAQPPATGDAQVASVAPTGDARADYDQAYKLVTAGRYDVAEAAFRQFIATYPNDELAPDAQYWLGESLYAHGDYAAAAEEFKTGYTKYPKSKRAPDALLKLGLSMAGLNFRDEACKMYALALKQYPQMSNGLHQRVKAEQASAAC